MVGITDYINYSKRQVSMSKNKLQRPKPSDPKARQEADRQEAIYSRANWNRSAVSNYIKDKETG